MSTDSVAAIEKILRVQLEAYHYKTQPRNAYVLRGGHITELVLEGVSLDSVEALLPHLPKLGKLKLNNCSIFNLSELLKFQTWQLSLRNVLCKQAYDAGILRDFKLKHSPREIYLSDMSFDADCLRDCMDLKYARIQNCHIQNLHGLAHCPKLYQLNLNNTTFEHTQAYIEQNGKKNDWLLLDLTDCAFENLDFLRPFAGSLSRLSLYDCQIERMDSDALDTFQNLGAFIIDAATTIQQGELKSVAPKRKKGLDCEFVGEKKAHSLKKLAAIAPHFSTLTLTDCKTEKLKGIELFRSVKHLYFSKTKVRLSDFLPLAKNIKSVEFVSSSLEGVEHWAQFPKLDNMEICHYERKKKGIGSLQKILPLRGQLKRLIISEELKDMESIGEFSRLEILDLYSVSLPVAEKIMAMSSLRKLAISIDTRKKCKLPLDKLSQLDFLQILDSRKVQLTGFEQLQKLEALELRGGIIDPNSLPALPTLKRLYLDIDDCRVEGLAQFPNLEKLKISSAESIQLSGLHRLKVLDLENNVRLKMLDCFEDLPNLEKLDLSSMYCQGEDCNLDLQKLQKLQKLKWLSLMDTPLPNLEGIEKLKSLEYLDLYDTEIADISPLNQLKKLKEVNLCTGAYAYEEEPFLAQLKRPEVAVFIGRPQIHFLIWDRLRL